MKDSILKILKDILSLFYLYSGITIVCTIMFIMLWQIGERSGYRNIVKEFLSGMKSRVWIRRFLFVFYCFFVLQRTVFNRQVWDNPLGDVLGPFKLIKDNGELESEIFENILLFVPLIPFGKLAACPYIAKAGLFKSVLISFILSLGIESVQLILSAGTFQLSDLCFNTIGGVIGYILYFCIKLIFRLFSGNMAKD